MPYLFHIMPIFIADLASWDNPRAGDPFIIVNKATNKLAYIDDGKIQKVFQ